MTNNDGTFHFTSLSEGIYRVDLELAGFKTAKIQHLELKSNAVTHARVAMNVNELETITVGAAVLSPIEQPTLSTTFTQSFIDNLPH